MQGGGQRESAQVPLCCLSQLVGAMPRFCYRQTNGKKTHAGRADTVIV